MRFEWNGADYQLEFQREYKQVRVGFDPIKNEDITKASRFPYTIARLWVLYPGAPKPEKHRETVVGAYHTDSFTLEKGRLAALRLMSRTLTKELKRALWACYMNRNNRDKSKEV